MVAHGTRPPPPLPSTWVGTARCQDAAVATREQRPPRQHQAGQQDQARHNRAERAGTAGMAVNGSLAMHKTSINMKSRYIKC